MYKKCVSCYENHKTPRDKDCQNCNEELQRLKAENEGLKIKHQRYRECSIQFNQKLKQALEEIREIAEKEIYLKQNSSLIKIIDKINEVLKDV